MAEFILSEKQFQKITDTISFQNDFELAKKNWENFSKEEKEAIVECLKVFYPEKAKLIKEASWLNTLGDIVGIFDPTGVVDLVNGISYITQGDNLFGFLSIISAVPYIGDVVAKPMMGALKIGAPSAKAIQKVMALSKAGKSAEAAAMLAKITETGGLTGKFVKGVGKVAGKARGYIERAPLGIFKGFKKTILQWFDLFEKAAKGGKTVRYAGQTLAKNIPKLSKAEQLAKLEQFKKIASSTNVFRSYRTTKGALSWKSLFRGMPQLMGRNASVRALMRQTKWWAGFLDYIGMGNFVGPEEISKKVGEQEFMKKMEEYQKTPESQSYFTDDFGPETQESTDTTQSTASTSKSQETSSSKDPFANFLGNLFKGTINPLPGV